MRTEKQKSTSPQNIMQVFQMANLEVAESNNVDDMIGAYDRVIKFCSSSAECRNETSTKRNVLLYWAYSNIAKSYTSKNKPDEASKYYEKALSVAVSKLQKTLALEALLNICDKENLKLVDKCRKIIRISNELIDIYRHDKNNKDLKRIVNLSEKTLEILKKAEI